jgi:acyl-homoserine-lactone acylase
MTRRAALLALVLLAACSPTGASREEVARWEARADAVTITRDDWGIAHVKGTSDADAVFGMLYAQAEDDFNRVEMNYLNAIGRYAEATGEQDLWRDLRARLFVDPDSMRALYETAPEWLKTLMVAATDGINYYLHTHPEVRPKVLTKFEPWMTLPFSEGSIGWDLETVSLARLKEFYDQPARVAMRTPEADRDAIAGPRTTSRAARRVATWSAAEETPEALAAAEPTGSNGIAIAPSKSASGRSLLLINPHTSFFFRSEMQVTSDSGLNAYGAVTWGQFFVYQGFNEKAGWMHTSSGVDQLDEYLETVTPAGDGFTYRYDGAERPVPRDTVTIRFRTDTGMAARTFTTYRTHHGPVVRAADGKWVTIRLMQEPVKALTQSFTRTKSTDHASFSRTMDLHTNSSNNTVFADASGNIAYFHANFVPKRDVRIDWTKPVDGSTSATEWQGVHTLGESPDLLNPPTGWIQNTNNHPWSAAGRESGRARDYPRYFDYYGENPRGLHALEVLQGKTGWTLETLMAAAYDPHAIAFDDLLPPLVRAFDGLPRSSPLRAKLAEPIDELRGWDRRWSTTSIPTTLAVFWGEELWRRAQADPDAEGTSLYAFMANRTSATEKLAALDSIVNKLTTDFGTWRTPWGDVNRFQRISPAIVHPFADSAASIPVGFTSSRWGSLASFGARPFNGSKKWYGTTGNSFVAVVEFGERVRAFAVTAGGQSGDPSSPHFNDQAERYSKGALRPVYFYPEELAPKAARTYRPGSKE